MLLLYPCSLEGTSRCSCQLRRHRWRHSHNHGPHNRPRSPRKKCHGNQKHMHSLKKEQKKKLDYEDETFRQIQIFPCAKCINALISNVYQHGIYFSILMFESQQVGLILQHDATSIHQTKSVGGVGKEVFSATFTKFLLPESSSLLITQAGSSIGAGIADAGVNWSLAVFALHTTCMQTELTAYF